MFRGFSFGGRHFCIYGGKKSWTKSVLWSGSGCVYAQDSQGLYMSGLTRSWETEKEVEMAGFASFLCFSHRRSQRIIVSFRKVGVTSTDAVLIDWPYDFRKLEETATISCWLPVSRLHMEFFTLCNSQPPITAALINLIENHQQGMLEIIFKLIEKNFQLRYWKIYTYLC